MKFKTNYILSNFLLMQNTKKHQVRTELWMCSNFPCTPLTPTPSLLHWFHTLCLCNSSQIILWQVSKGWQGQTALVLTPWEGHAKPRDGPGTAETAQGTEFWQPVTQPYKDQGKPSSELQNRRNLIEVDTYTEETEVRTEHGTTGSASF